GEGVAPEVADLGHRLERTVPRSGVVNRDVRALAREAGRERAPEAAARARDERVPALEPAHAVLPRRKRTIASSGSSRPTIPSGRAYMTRRIMSTRTS